MSPFFPSFHDAASGREASKVFDKPFMLAPFPSFHSLIQGEPVDMGLVVSCHEVAALPVCTGNGGSICV